jgi:uncharacterized membrane protein
MLKNILLVAHVVSSAIWIGAVFMGSVIDWPAARDSIGQNTFPLSFVVEQGKRVFFWVYLGISIVLMSGVVLTYMNPPQNMREIMFIITKFILLSIMTGNTIYGTLVTWPSIQFATFDEARILWSWYMKRAYITLACGVLNFAMGIIFR